WRLPQYRLAQSFVRDARPEEARPFLERVETLRVREADRINALDRFMRGERTAELAENLGKLCRETGLLMEARSWFEETNRLDPNRSEAREAVRTLAIPAADPAPIPRLRPRTVVAAPAPAPLPTTPPRADPAKPFRFEEV